MLEGLLERAKRGDILGFGAYWVLHNRDIEFGNAVGAAPRNLMVAGVAYLHHAVMRADG